MKKRFVFGAILALFVVSVGVAFAADPTFTSGGAVIVEEKSVFDGRFGSILESVVLAVITGLGALLAMAMKFITHKMEGSKTRNILRIAAAAVNYAEAKWGPDSGKGKEKEEAAISFVMEHFKGVRRDQAEKFVKAAYSALFQGLDPLKNTPAGS